MFLVSAELIGASTGLGYLLVDGQNSGRADIIVMSINLLALIGKLTDLAPNSPNAASSAGQIRECSRSTTYRRSLPGNRPIQRETQRPCVDSGLETSCLARQTGVASGAVG